MKQTAHHKRKYIMLWVGLALLFLGFTGWVLWGNSALTVTEFQLEILPEEGSYVIAQVSDFHNAEFGKDNCRLVALLKSIAPDAIVVTGDLIDRPTRDSAALDFMRQAPSIAPVYFVTGNHEAWIYDAYPNLDEKLQERGITILSNEAVTLEGVPLELIGLDDPAVGLRDDPSAQPEELLRSSLEKLVPVKGEGEKDVARVLLAHRPEYIQVYQEFDIDLVLSGHAHGGQVRLPFVGGVYADGQGWFPQYDSGLYYGSDGEGDTLMVVSRGLGNSLPLRINNRPEVVVVRLTGKQPE